MYTNYACTKLLHCILCQVSLPFMKTLTAPGQAGAQRPHVGVQAQDKRYPWCQQRTCPPVCHHFMRRQDDQRQTPQQQAFLEMPRERNYKKRWRQHSKLSRRFNSCDRTHRQNVWNVFLDFSWASYVVIITAEVVAYISVLWNILIY